MLSTHNNPPSSYSIMLSLTKDSGKSSHNAYSGGTSHLMDTDTNFPTQASTHWFPVSWQGWAECFKGYLSPSRRGDPAMQAVLKRGEKLRQAAESLKDQIQTRYEIQQQTGCQLGWKTWLAGGLASATAAIFGYGCYAGWWRPGNSNEISQLSGQDLVTRTGSGRSLQKNPSEPERTDWSVQGNKDFSLLPAEADPNWRRFNGSSEILHP